MDGFASPFVSITDSNVDAIRSAMAEIAKDDTYWEGLREIAALNRKLKEVREYVEAMK